NMLMTPPQLLVGVSFISTSRLAPCPALVRIYLIGNAAVINRLDGHGRNFAQPVRSRAGLSKPESQLVESLCAINSSAAQKAAQYTAKLQSNEQKLMQTHKAENEKPPRFTGLYGAIPILADKNNSGAGGS